MRLSVRFLMVFVLVVGSWLGWYIRSVRLQEAAVAAVKKAPGAPVSCRMSEKLPILAVKNG